MIVFAFFLGMFCGCILMAIANYLDWKARVATRLNKGGE